MTDVIARCRKTWRRLGVPNEAAASMAEELTADLAGPRCPAEPRPTELQVKSGPQAPDSVGDSPGV